MSTNLKVLTLAALCLASVSVSQAQQTLVDFNLSSAQIGNPPPTAKFDPGTTNQSLDSITTTEANKLEVVTYEPTFTGNVLRFTKGSSEPRSPRAIFVNSPGVVTKGKVKFTWTSTVDGFTPSEKFPGFEALMTFLLTDSIGKPFYTFYYLVDKDQNGGSFGNMGQKQGKWSLSTKQQFEVLLDLDANTVLVTVDGDPLGEPQKVSPSGGLRLVQFTDGTGLAFYGGKFTATLGSFKMTSL